MKITRWLLTAMVVLSISAAISFALRHEWKQAAYWVLVAALNAVASTF